MSDYLYQAARGVDLRPVQAHRNRKSIGGERTFKVDISSAQPCGKTGETIKLLGATLNVSKGGQLPQNQILISGP